MARGISARNSGERFIKDNTVFTVDQVLLLKKDDLQNHLTNVTVFQTFEKKNSEYCILLLMKNCSNTYAFIKEVKDLGLNNLGHGKWSTKEFEEQTGLIFDSKNSKKEKNYLKASNLIRNSFSTVQEARLQVESQIYNSGLEEAAISGIIEAFHDLEAGNLPIVRNCSQYHEIIRDYFGEIIAPICLVNNIGFEPFLKDIKGAFGIKNDDSPFINFSRGKNFELIDSTISWNEKTIGISSKGGTGASASISSLYNLFNQMKFDNEEAYAKLSFLFPKEIEFLKKNISDGVSLSPINNALQFNLITESDYQLITSLLEVSSLENGLDRIRLDASDNLKIILNRKMKDPSKSFFNFFMISCLAKANANHINNSGSNLSQFLLEVLKNSNIVQVHAKTKMVGNHILFQPFNVIFPPNFSGKLIVEADKSYYSTKAPQGGLGFKLVC